MPVLRRDKHDTENQQRGDKASQHQVAISVVGAVCLLTVYAAWLWSYLRSDRDVEPALEEASHGVVPFRTALAVLGSLPFARRVGARTATYDPTARFDITVDEVELRRNAAGRMLMARIYRPGGAGPFPVVLVSAL